MHYTSEEQCRKMLADMLKKMRAIENNMGLGVLYWEPQAGPGYNRGYNLGAWGADGKPTQALKGFIETVSTSVPSCKQRGMINTNSIISCTGHGIKIKFPQICSGTIICLYQADGKLVYKNIISTKADIRLPFGTYFLKIRGGKMQTLFKTIVVN